MLRTHSILIAALLASGCGGTPLEPWHTERLHAEFTADDANTTHNLDDYRAQEAQVFAELDAEVYARSETGPEHLIERYSAGSLSDPRDDGPDWNRTFEHAPTDEPVAGVLLLHGMSDSPYSLRALAARLGTDGYHVVGLRLPGHGTAPSGLRHVKGADLRAAVRVGMTHLAEAVGEAPIHIVGYSTGATLALDYAVDAAIGTVEPVPASLVLISPAIRIHPAARLARFKDALAAIPGLGGLAWLDVMPEFDPYKYNSFATNSGTVVHRLTTSVDARITGVAADPHQVLPPILAVKSTVDATVTTEAIVGRLLGRLTPHRHELILFDVNRLTAAANLMVDAPGPLTGRWMKRADLPFTLTVVTNAALDSQSVVARRKAPFSATQPEGTPLDARWPPGVLSLSHVALPFRPDDPLYGRTRPETPDRIFLGDMALRGERGLLALPPEWLLRMRYNPFYDFTEQRVLDWLEAAASSGGAEAAGPP